MNNQQRIEELENLLARILQPIKDIPFSVVIKSLSNHRLIELDLNTKQDNQLLDDLVNSIKFSYDGGYITRIKSARVNEVGNKIEEPLMNGINYANTGLRACRPNTKDGKKQSSGYPDILLYDKDGRPTYLEVKTFSPNSKETFFRSFYLSPSNSFKVDKDARHLLVGFEIEKDGDQYKPISWELIDLYKIKCNLKHEFNTNNKCLYDQANIMSSGKVNVMK